MSFMDTSGTFGHNLSLFMMQTCTLISSKKFDDGLLLTIHLIPLHLSPTNSARALGSFTVNVVEYVPELIILSLCCSCSWSIHAKKTFLAMLSSTVLHLLLQKYTDLHLQQDIKI